MGGLLGVGLISRGLSKGFSNAASAAVLRLPAFTLHAPMSPKVGQAPPSPLRRQGTSVIVRSRSLQHKIHPVQSVSREELASYLPNPQVRCLVVIRASLLSPQSRLIHWISN